MVSATILCRFCGGMVRMDQHLTQLKKHLESSHDVFSDIEICLTMFLLSEDEKEILKAKVKPRFVQLVQEGEISSKEKNIFQETTLEEKPDEDLTDIQNLLQGENDSDDESDDNDNDENEDNVVKDNINDITQIEDERTRERQNQILSWLNESDNEDEHDDNDDDKGSFVTEDRSNSANTQQMNKKIRLSPANGGNVSTSFKTLNKIDDFMNLLESQKGDDFISSLQSQRTMRRN